MANAGPGLGVCVRFPPQMVVEPGNPSSTWARPTMRHDDTCGEFVAIFRAPEAPTKEKSPAPAPGV